MSEADRDGKSISMPAELISVMCEPVEDPFVPVKSGSIVLKGTVHLMDIERYTPGNYSLASFDVVSANIPFREWCSTSPNCMFLGYASTVSRQSLYFMPILSNFMHGTAPYPMRQYMGCC